MMAPLLLDLGKHAVFIWSSYAIVAIVIVVLIAWLVIEGRKYQRQIAQLKRSYHLIQSVAVAQYPCKHLYYLVSNV